MIHGVNSLKPLTSIKCENSKWIMLIYDVMIISMRHRVPTILFKDKYNNCWMKFFPLIEGLTLRSFVFRCVRKKKIHKLYMPMTCYTHSNLLSIPPQPSPRSAERNWITAFWVFYLLPPSLICWMKLILQCRINHALCQIVILIIHTVCWLQNSLYLPRLSKQILRESSFNATLFNDNQKVRIIVHAMTFYILFSLFKLDHLRIHDAETKLGLAVMLLYCVGFISRKRCPRSLHVWLLGAKLSR